MVWKWVGCRGQLRVGGLWLVSRLGTCHSQLSIVVGEQDDGERGWGTLPSISSSGWLISSQNLVHEKQGHLDNLVVHL